MTSLLLSPCVLDAADDRLQTSMLRRQPTHARHPMLQCETKEGLKGPGRCYKAIRV